MERGLLSQKELASSYGDVVWMYLFQDFSKSDEDRAAERVAIRFGISSWPQHFLVDPFTLEVIADTGRSLESFRAAVKSVRVKKTEASPSPADFKLHDDLAAALEANADLALATKHLMHEDVVVRYRAVQVLAKKKPEVLTKESGRLLASDNDQIRYLVCDALTESGTVGAKDALGAVVKDTGKSKNPNVLRMHAVQALAKCGDKSSLALIAPHATSGAYLNSLTAAAIATIQAIAERDPSAKSEAVAILEKAYPVPPDAEKAATEKRACESLADRVHTALKKLTGKSVPFPKPYDAAARESLTRAW